MMDPLYPGYYDLVATPPPPLVAPKKNRGIWAKLRESLKPSRDSEEVVLVKKQHPYWNVPALLRPKLTGNGDGPSNGYAGGSGQGNNHVTWRGNNDVYRGGKQRGGSVGREAGKWMGPPGQQWGDHSSNSSSKSQYEWEQANGHHGQRRLPRSSSAFVQSYLTAHGSSGDPNGGSSTLPRNFASPSQQRSQRQLASHPYVNGGVYPYPTDRVPPSYAHAAHAGHNGGSGDSSNSGRAPQLLSKAVIWKLILEVVEEEKLGLLSATADSTKRAWWKRLMKGLRRRHGFSKASGLANQLMQNPAMLAAIQGKLANMDVGDLDAFASLSAPVKRRVKALKKIQADVVNVESEFCREVHELECKYAERYAPFFTKRQQIVSGNVEPTDSDCDWPSDEDEDEEDGEDEDGEGGKSVRKAVGKLSMEDEKKGETAGAEQESAEDAGGIPSFWLNTFKNVSMLGSMIQPHDEPILETMVDLTLSLVKDPPTYTLSFHFAPNQFFSETVLTKTYSLKVKPDETDVFAFDGPEIVNCQGCTINWEKGMNVTMKTVKKKQKHKGRGTTRMVTKTVQNDSFFNFFNPPEMPSYDEENEVDDETDSLIAADFEIGNFIRERIVPRAVLYFTGEAVEEEYDDEGEEDEDDDYEGEEDEDDEDDEEGEGGEKNAQNCKQQ